MGDRARWSNPETNPCLKVCYASFSTDTLKAKTIYFPKIGNLGVLNLSMSIVRSLSDRFISFPPVDCEECVRFFVNIGIIVMEVMLKCGWSR